jgi:hypothetical protein
MNTFQVSRWKRPLTQMMYERFLSNWVFFLTATDGRTNCQFKVTTSIMKEAGVAN